MVECTPITILLVYDPLSSLAYPMIPYTHSAAGNLPIKILVAKHSQQVSLYTPGIIQYILALAVHYNNRNELQRVAKIPHIILLLIACDIGPYNTISLRLTPHYALHNTTCACSCVHMHVQSFYSQYRCYFKPETNLPTPRQWQPRNWHWSS